MFVRVIRPALAPRSVVAYLYFYAVASVKSVGVPDPSVASQGTFGGAWMGTPSADVRESKASLRSNSSTAAGEHGQHEWRQPTVAAPSHGWTT